MEGMALEEALEGGVVPEEVFLETLEVEVVPEEDLVGVETLQVEEDSVGGQGMMMEALEEDLDLKEVQGLVGAETPEEVFPEVQDQVDFLEDEFILLYNNTFKNLIYFL